MKALILFLAFVASQSLNAIEIAQCFVDVFCLTKESKEYGAITTGEVLVEGTVGTVYGDCTYETLKKAVDEIAEGRVIVAPKAKVTKEAHIGHSSEIRTLKIAILDGRPSQLCKTETYQVTTKPTKADGKRRTYVIP